ncbi:hypothetical protein HNQ10_004226 [Deinococcus metallilatus]|uniref:Uncharacterized protein n=1 Tax=Deinococcus metallilatus TaxID=1211322 RepID=A0ABR6MZK7_9DEIO|nr:hypothetical protein [Deinococcus metallilatus]
MHPADERAQKLVLALRNHNLDQVIAMLPALGQPSRVMRSSLKPVFDQAARDGINLLNPVPVDAPHPEPVREVRLRVAINQEDAVPEAGQREADVAYTAGLAHTTGIT